MNNVAILPKLCMRFLQTQNVKRQIAPVHVESSKDVLEPTSDTDKKEN